ncbi:phosphatidylinositol synthase 1 (CDP-alcohol phosphatidyltransferase1) [Coemansia guatemalensis]|uniref:CDP-diacylglycerol--inositol 3-phosphatidyltransferase n=1 Tax=Coemansia guatemalensis TaxID=2761395 RepID=A0A9W8HX08_9FUNG|nr:phosphatidylinositol synthase 1 (CDP-alcohol phosphatidyltransferase1) [Coemansia guatemalensis]
MTQMKHSDVFWFVPNLIGYFRVSLGAVVAFSMYYEYPYVTFICYLASGLLDGADGYYARKLGQCSMFGEVLDMVTDRCTAATLLIYLTQLYKSPLLALAACFLISLDISSHYMQMFAQLMVGKTNHKQMDENTHWALKLFYTDKRIFIPLCFGNEAFYLLLYMDKYLPTYALYISIPLTFVALPLCLIKNAINAVQLYVSACELACLDAAKFNKSKK